MRSYRGSAVQHIGPLIMADGDPEKSLAIADVWRVKLWLAERGIVPSEEQLHVLAPARSGAEALLAWQFASKPTTRIVDGAFVNNGLTLLLNVPAKLYYIDLVAWRGDFRLAIEVDGYAFHHHTPAQVADDDLRQRRLVLFGYTVIRFGAREVFRDPTACWRQVEAIIERRT
jgi:hypothetical protein